MDVIHSVREMQARALEWLRAGRRTALVPTMGALHRGHVTLIERAKQLGDPVVLSIFVNPTQFGPNEDFGAYPRTLEADCEAARAAGTDVVFAPSPAEIYPAGYQAQVELEGMAAPLCGPWRPGHFRGVATVVTKLFLITLPRVAVFGWKDAQQFILLRRMAADLNIPVELVGVETIREADGLAMSSRNKYLTPEQRAAAPALYRGLKALATAAESGERDARSLIALAKREVEREPLIRLEYLDMVSIGRLEPLLTLERGNTLIALAARVGQARLIDNVRL